MIFPEGNNICILAFWIYLYELKVDNSCWHILIFFSKSNMIRYWSNSIIALGCHTQLAFRDW